MRVHRVAIRYQFHVMRCGVWSPLYCVLAPSAPLSQADRQVPTVKLARVAAADGLCW